MQDLPDKSDISIVLVKNERELQRYNIDAIAQDLGGTDVWRMYPIFLVFYKGTIRGYIQAVQQTCIYTTLHPELMNIREYLKITRSVITEIQRNCGNPIFMLCDRALTTGARVLKHVRLKRAKETAFVYDHDAY